MSPSRVMSGRDIVLAAAQMSASNGSRLKRSSSARKICSAVASNGWYAGFVNKSSKNDRTVRRRLILETRASRLHSQMTAAGT